MARHKTISAGELAERKNAQARAVWAAARRGEVQLLADGFPVTDMRVDKQYHWLEVTLGHTFKMPVTSDMRLKIKPMRQPTGKA
jgi:hypothetical protein